MLPTHITNSCHELIHMTGAIESTSGVGILNKTIYLGGEERRGAYCSVLQCVAVCCSVLQCVAVCCSVLQCVANHLFGQRTAQRRLYILVCCSVMQCVAVCCSVLQCVAVC